MIFLKRMVIKPYKAPTVRKIQEKRRETYSFLSVEPQLAKPRADPQKIEARAKKNCKASDKIFQVIVRGMLKRRIEHDNDEGSAMEHENDKRKCNAVNSDELEERGTTMSWVMPRKQSSHKWCCYFTSEVTLYTSKYQWSIIYGIYFRREENFMVSTFYTRFRKQKWGVELLGRMCSQRGAALTTTQSTFFVVTLQPMLHSQMLSSVVKHISTIFVIIALYFLSYV